MDRITKSLMLELLDSLEIKSTTEPKDFEKFCNYVAVSNEYNKTFDLESITVGDGDDTGIDGIAIIVNGQMIESVEEVDDLIEKNNFLEVDYIFIQAKTSSKFEGSEISTFLLGVKDFFSENPVFRRNANIKSSVDISNYIISKAPKFRRNPILKLYYITTGKWIDDENLKGLTDNLIRDIEDTNLFEKVCFHPFGSRELSNCYRKTKDAISNTIIFSNRITMPQINGISQAYIGLLPFNEFLKLISDKEDHLLNVFEDNVRDFQGENNDVNGGIAETLNNIDSDIFSVLNNGVTIVASSISPTGDQFTLTDYQIVNGCQTSNVLYNQRNSDNINKVYVPIKLIATTDDDVKTRITLATNNQTPIKKEQLAVLTRFQKDLELYYKSIEEEHRLYYERRAKQYSSDNNIIKSKIITLQNQIKSFAAVFLEEPHNVTSFYGMIVKRMNEGKIKIFNNDHKYCLYYTSAYAFYKLETFFKKGMIEASYKKVRFHILLIFRIITEKENLPYLNSNKSESYCNFLLSVSIN